MFKKTMIPFLAGLIAMIAAMTGSMALPGPEGKVVLIGFWQAGCEQCEAYISWLTRMQADHGDEGLVIVAVNQDRDTSAATDLLNKIATRGDRDSQVAEKKA